MATMNISLPDAMKDWVEAKVSEGQHANASDYIRDLIRTEQKRTDARMKLDQMVDQALASGIVEMTGDELLARMESKRAEASAKKKSA